MTTSLVPADASPEALPTSPVPTFSGGQMAQAFRAYQDLQRALDASMPDQILDLDGRKFRKKGYWRAIAVAFNLTVEPVEERREVQGTFEDGQDNFGWVVTYRARTPSGRTAAGDGTCYASEKVPRSQANRWQALPKQATEHNVRSHACTRAFNRAVSNLVGFGEVSAEEVDRDDDTRLPGAARATVPPAARDDRKISKPQEKRFWAIARGNHRTDDWVHELLLRKYSVHTSSDLRVSVYEHACADLIIGPPSPEAA